jgi:CO/xanthine dehydrogenase Mo-binding subunit
MRFDNGQPINATFLEYLLPSMHDHPGEFAALSIETPHPDGPFGAKGMGEAALPPIAPAIGNAIANALNGVRVRELPMKPEKVFAAVQAAKARRG